MSAEKRPEPSSQLLALEQIDSAAFQIRQDIDDDRLRELASSMQQRGLLQPILVRPKGDRFEIVAGERRFRAAKLLQWSSIRCDVAERSDLDAEIDKVIENEQRVDAKPLERARAFAHLRDDFHLEQEEIARRVGVHKSVVCRTLALLKQPAEIQKLVAEESISPGHLRSLEAIADESKRVELAAQAAKEHLSVREIQRRAREAAAKSESAAVSDAAIASAPPEIQKTVADEGSSPDPPRAQDAISEPQPVEAPAQTQAAKDQPTAKEIERRATEAATALQAQTMPPTIVNWRHTFWDTLSGPWVFDVAWDLVRRLYEKLTDRATMVRFLKAVLKQLARFIPGREREISPLLRYTKFRDLLPPTNREANKPDSHPPKAA